MSAATQISKCPTALDQKGRILIGHFFIFKLNNWRVSITFTVTLGYYVRSLFGAIVDHESSKGLGYVVSDLYYGKVATNVPPGATMQKIGRAHV